MNSGKAGRTYPVKWQCRAADGSYVRDLGTVQASGSQEMPCASLSYDSSDPLEVSTSGSSVLRYDLQDEQFVFNWQTPRLSGTHCYVFVLILSDGSTHSALFRLSP